MSEEDEEINKELMVLRTAQTALNSVIENLGALGVEVDYSTFNTQRIGQKIRVNRFEFTAKKVLT